MCASCSMPGGFRCNVHAAFWPAPMSRRRTAGAGTSIRTLKKSPSAALGADLHGRSQFPTGLDPARDLEPRGLPSISFRHRGAKSVKILGAIELWRTRVDYRQDTALNAKTYLGFLQLLAHR